VRRGRRLRVLEKWEQHAVDHGGQEIVVNRLAGNQQPGEDQRGSDLVKQIKVCAFRQESPLDAAGGRAPP